MDAPYAERAAEVIYLIEQCGLGRHLSVFRENDVDDACLGTLTSEDFAELGLPMGPRARLVRAIRERNAAAAVAPAAPPPPPPPADPSDDDDALCELCWDRERDCRLAGCGHAFCRTCVADWRRQSAAKAQAGASCPTCRKPFGVADVVDLASGRRVDAPRPAWGGAAAAPPVPFPCAAEADRRRREAEVRAAAEVEALRRWREAEVAHARAAAEAETLRRRREAEEVRARAAKALRRREAEVRAAAEAEARRRREAEAERARAAAEALALNATAAAQAAANSAMDAGQWASRKERALPLMCAPRLFSERGSGQRRPPGGRRLPVGSISQPTSRPRPAPSRTPAYARWTGLLHLPPRAPRTTRRSTGTLPRRPSSRCTSTRPWRRVAGTPLPPQFLRP